MLISVMIGFPPKNPQVIELYWPSPQLCARTHPSLLEAQKPLMSLRHASDAESDSPISLRTPLSYADRLRIRQPGDAQFALGPHQDGGSVERWEMDGYGEAGYTMQSPAASGKDTILLMPAAACMP